MCLNLRLLDAMVVLSALTALCGEAAAANWQPVATYQGERVEIDKTRIARIGDGKTMAWNRLMLGREESIPNSKDKYSTVQALNRYDCEKGSFATTKRVFMRDAMGLAHGAFGLPDRILAIAAGTQHDPGIRPARRKLYGFAGFLLSINAT